ncbi:MAG: guanylate kinase [Elusimicrobia bacterium RIFCSPLOWO2_01_FULL_59_12]|nr:MAG: guanylate kinase [Elusimicrobia bacterium RIFCSPLOWO2_01_FULL_59_12]
MRKGLLVVVSAASGAGKSTLCRLLLQRRKNLKFSVSATTRLPRPGEKDGREYFFLSDAAFRAMRARGDLVEWARVHDHLYGTPKAFLSLMRARGKDVLLDLDVQGALAVKRRYPEAVLIFVRTPRFADLKKRLRSRLSETETQIRRRLKTARKELRLARRYDYQVINDRVPRALKQLDAILKTEAKLKETDHG